MASIGSVNTAATSFRAEATNALVNINLELNFFTKRLVEPPQEYAGVGQNLAPSRRHEAQEGVRHTIARKLGLPFKDRSILPATPELIKAYGSRASDIARSSAANPQGDASHGAYAGMIGADATTLWAAATSGLPAIQCHLLACLLARIWEPAEATSIWVEIVTKRKAELKLRLINEGELDHDVLFVVTEELPRSHLRDWDASARAWIRVADSVMARQQTQLRLIVDNLSIPVNTKPEAYESVINAWSSAMMQMEKLLVGVPLQVHSGDILLGLLSWHLYPDMKYLGKEERHIEQHDPLLEGRGILTLGLEPSPRIAKDCQSVYWALPLSHLRYYGRLPVTRTRSARSSDRDRIRVDELLWVWISSYILAWDDGSAETREVLQFVSEVAIELHAACDFGNPDLNGRGESRLKPQCELDSWFLMLSRVCLSYKDRLDDERVRKLRNMGQSFHVFPHNGPFQGIFNISTYLKVAQSLEDKISFLREIAASIAAPKEGNQGYEFIITYKNSYTDLSERGQALIRERFEYATACPEYDGNKDSAAGNCNTRSHLRWLSFEPDDFVGTEDWMTAKSHMEEIQNMGEKAKCFEASSRLFTHHKKRNNIINVVDRSHQEIFVDFHNSRREKSVRRKYRNSRNYVSMKVDSRSAPAVEFDVLYGDIETIALLRRPPLPVIHQNERGYEKDRDSEGQKKLSTKEIMQLFRPGKVDFSQCSRELRLDVNSNTALLAMTFIESLYKSMDGATVDVRTVQFALRDALWLDSAIKSLVSTTRTPVEIHEEKLVPILTTEMVDSATCFACIAMMETGTYNLNPDELQNVFAIGAADSLYIASVLLQDPANEVVVPIRRFTGNIGRAGMAFMVPPKQPEIKPYDRIDEWYQCDHREFDGKLENCFEGTSLHISFSEASQAINVDFEGGRDVEAYFLETLISVHDRETWIAELDVISALKTPKDRLIHNFLEYRSCRCGASPTIGPQIISIDNFAEMIIPPRKAGIIRANGNWQARLAAASICLAKGYTVILKSENTCWGCLSKVSIDHLTVALIIGGNAGVVVII